jgi:hypothetical protein
MNAESFELKILKDQDFICGNGFGDGEEDQKSFNLCLYGNGRGGGMGTYEIDGSGYGEAGLDRRRFNVVTFDKDFLENF